MPLVDMMIMVSDDLTMTYENLFIVKVTLALDVVNIDD
jgi:hypothetical protein